MILKKIKGFIEKDQRLKRENKEGKKKEKELI